MIRRWLRRGLDEIGLVARAYDVRAHVAHALDRKTRGRNAHFRTAGAPDGLPLPPPSLVYLVAGHFNVEWYSESGVSHTAQLKEVLTANGLDISEFNSLLDFGCGCGRVIRHWNDQPALRLHGTDYTVDQARVVVLAPGGVLAVTTKGRSRLEPLGEEERRRFERGELVVQDERYEDATFAPLITQSATFATSSPARSKCLISSPLSPGVPSRRTCSYCDGPDRRTRSPGCSPTATPPDRSSSPLASLLSTETRRRRMSRRLRRIKTCFSAGGSASIRRNSRR
jgi:hypothetical protein